MLTERKRAGSGRDASREVGMEGRETEVKKERTIRRKWNSGHSSLLAFNLSATFCFQNVTFSIRF